MECLALKSSLREEFFSQLSTSDEGCCAAAVVVAAEEYFAVDDLLDLSNEGVNVEEEEEEEDDGEGEKRSPASDVSSFDDTNLESSTTDGGKSTDSVSFPDDLGSVPVSIKLFRQKKVRNSFVKFETFFNEYEQADDLEELEWLSRFVDDSFSEMPPACNSATFFRQPTVAAATTTATEREPQPVKRPAHLLWEPQVPGRCRSKRRRVRRGPSPTTSSSSSSSSCLIFANPGPNPDLVYYLNTAGSKISNRTKETAPAQPRRCSHCLVQKTPQWRTGPLGSKTLCNACGVRYKSGRLLPEYRPAGSPTFVSHIHSNSHRKVLEMRRKKDLVHPPEPRLQAAAQVQTF